MKKEGGTVMEKNNIVYDSYYLVSLFNNEKKDITQLQIQKLMYFFEAYYMNVKNTNEPLYECNFNAWMFGPVAIPLYKEYKNFGEFNIILDESKRKIGKEISKGKRMMLDEIYRTFGKLEPSKLVEITHLSDSPWYDVWMKNGKRVVYGSGSYIDKNKTKEWFKKHFINEK